VTKDEIRAFVKATITDEDFITAVEKIVERWEEDVQDNRDESYQSGVHVGYESAHYERM